MARGVFSVCCVLFHLALLFLDIRRNDKSVGRFTVHLFLVDLSLLHAMTVLGST